MQKENVLKGNLQVKMKQGWEAATFTHFMKLKQLP